MSGKPIPEAVLVARQIIDEFIQCAEVGRPHGKLIAQARDWLALTAAQQQGQACEDEYLSLLDWLWKERGCDNDDTIYSTFSNFLPRLQTLTAPPPGVPVGWKLVPVEPTEAMQDAHRMYGDTSDWWNAMLAAAPALATQHQESKS
jgi:hypothetical protein